MAETPPRVQLDTLSLVHELLAARKIDHWLFGGWALDFLLGRITRPHHDVDFIIWSSDATAAAAALQAAGFESREVEWPDEGAKFSRGPVDVEITYIETAPDGKVVTPGRWSDWPWPPDSFVDRPESFEGITCPVASPEALLDTKQNLGNHPAGRPMRPHDRVDIELLEELLD